MTEDLDPKALAGRLESIAYCYGSTLDISAHQALAEAIAALASLPAQAELAERKRLETATIDERLDWVAARVAVDEWFKESNAARTGYEVEQFKSRIRSELLDAACELALPYRDRAEKAEQELAEARAAERQLAERTAERDEWSDAFVRTDKQLQAALALIEAKPLNEWHEDDGFAVWWTLKDGGWLGEPAYIGSPLCDDWPGYHTHWTPHPEFPAKTPDHQENTNG